MKTFISKSITISLHVRTRCLEDTPTLGRDNRAVRERSWFDPPNSIAHGEAWSLRVSFGSAIDAGLLCGFCMRDEGAHGILQAGDGRQQFRGNGRR